MRHFALKISLPLMTILLLFYCCRERYVMLIINFRQKIDRICIIFYELLADYIKNGYLRGVKSKP